MGGLAPVSDRHNRMHRLIPLLAAAVVTALNALKPPLVDDTAYYAVARQIARLPFDPYGFEQFWYNSPQPANEILAPPVFPYWLGVGMRIVGDDPVRLKLWLYPIVALFACAWYALLRRFALSAATPVLWLTLLCPTFVPSLNFMLDIPAVALILAALVMFLRALETQRIALALITGIIAGLAAQTKYTGGLVWPLIVIAAFVCRFPLTSRRTRLLFAASAVAVAIAAFTGWEIFIWQKYGASHFLFQLRDNSMSMWEKIQNGPALVVLLGGMLPPATVAALLGLRWQRGFTLFCALILAGYAAILLVPGTSRSAWVDRDDRQPIDVAAAVFTILGCLSASTMLYVALRLLMRWRHKRPALRASWPDMFLAAWFFLEIAGYFALTTFPATRRVFGIVLVGALLGARLLSMAHRRSGARMRWLAVVPGCSLGLLYIGLNIREAQFEPEAVRTASAEIRSRDPEARIWFVGHWGFQFEAERLGLLPVIPNRSKLEAGDWLLLPETGCVHQQSIQIEAEFAAKARDWEFRHPVPLRVIPPYYGGHLPLERWAHPHLTVYVYRVREPWTPAAP